MNDHKEDILTVGEIKAHLRENPILLGTIGYLFLLIFRPFEYWPWLGDLRIERVYMLFLMPTVLLWRGKKHIPHNINRTLVVFFSVVCLSTLVALRFDAAYDQSFKYFKLIVLYFIVLLTVNSEKDFKVLVISFVTIMGVYVGKSLWEFLFHGRYQYRMGIPRLIGIDQTYHDPNSFASTIVYSLPFALALFKSALSPLLKRASLFYGLMCICAVVLTGSRGGMVLTALFFFMVAFRGKQKGKAVFLVILLLAAVWVFSPSYIHNRLDTMVDMSANESATISAMGRLEGLINGFRLFYQRPLLGWGAGNFMHATPLLGIDNNLQAHNLYGQLAAELGIIGILSFSGFCIAYLATIRRISMAAAGMEDSPRLAFLRHVNEACFLGFVLLLLNGFLGHSLYRYNWVLFSSFLVITDSLADDFLAAVSKNDSPKRSHDLRQSRRLDL